MVVSTYTNVNQQYIYNTVYDKFIIVIQWISIALSSNSVVCTKYEIPRLPKN